ncbi:MAG: glycosyltransferase family 4 protein [Candidatus Tectimicrobiota bacterium]
MRRALFYFTYNGIYNFTNGIGTQTQLLLRGLEHLRPRLRQHYGSFDVHIVCPQPDQHTWGYDAHFFQQQQARLAALQGRLHLLPYKSRPETALWEVATWQHLSAQAAQLLQQQAQQYDTCLAFCVDQPWLQTPAYLRAAPADTQARVRSLLILYSTAFIRNAAAPDKDEMCWERTGLAQACDHPAVALADICPSFTSHVQTLYALPHLRLAPYTSSILPADDTFHLLDEAEVVQTLRRYDVPLERDLIVAFGRATPLKGFETLIPALAAVRERCHFVLISVPYPGETHQQTYDRLLAEHRLQATHVRAFSRDLPRALCQWARTRMVVVPSHQETFSNIPLEVALWARRQGPVLVASQVGGFVDQIEPGVNGFLMDITRPESITRTVRHVLDLAPETLAALRQRAYDTVLQRYDFQQNFPRTLAWFWGAEQASPPPPASAPG